MSMNELIQEMSNTNCLEGWSCPECHQEDRFDVEVHVTVTLFDDGVEGINGDTEYDDDNNCSCPECGHRGKVGDFRKDVKILPE